MYVVITGLDGAGKTGLMLKLSSALNATTLHLPNLPSTLKLLNLSGNGTQYGDTWTDRLIFALDNRLSNYKIQSMLKDNDTLLSQRGWMDSLIHGAVQGYDYEEMLKLNRITELTKPDATIYLVCEPSIAWSRVKDHKNRDKYESLDYLKKQCSQTIDFYNQAGSGDLDYFDEKRYLIDTSSLTPAEVYSNALRWLKSQDLPLQRERTSNMLR